MRTEQTHGRLSIRSVDDLVGLVPYLIGFHPEESLVVMMLEAGQVVVTARVDLDAVRDPLALDALLVRLFSRFPTAEGWFVAYTDDDALAWGVLAECVQLVGRSHLGRLLQVGAHRWRADRADGETGDIDAVVSAVAAQAAVLGLPARSSRRDLADGIAGPPDAEIDSLLAEFEVGAAELDELGARGRRRMLERLLRAPSPVRRCDCVRLALLVARPEGLLDALAAVSRDNAEQHLQVWTQVVRHCLVVHRPAALGLLGVAAWQTGDGALQVVCLEQLDRLQPSAPLGALLDWLNVHVVPPQDWDVLRNDWLSALASELRVAGPRSSRRRR